MNEKIRSMIGELIRLLCRTKPPENGREERVKGYLEMLRETRLFAPSQRTPGTLCPRSGDSVQGAFGGYVASSRVQPFPSYSQGVRHTKYSKRVSSAFPSE